MILPTPYLHPLRPHHPANPEVEAAFRESFRQRSSSLARRRRMLRRRTCNIPFRNDRSWKLLWTLLVPQKEPFCPRHISMLETALNQLPHQASLHQTYHHRHHHTIISVEARWHPDPTGQTSLHHLVAASFHKMTTTCMDTTLATALCRRPRGVPTPLP
jgi:hypothetical protein